MPLPHLGIGSMAPGMELCAFKLTVLTREEPTEEYRAPKPRGPGWPLALMWGALGDTTCPLCLWHEGSLCLFMCLLVWVSVCPTWADQDSSAGCVSQVISSPAKHSTWKLLWCFSTARGRQVHSAQTLGRRAIQNTAERGRSRHAVRPLSAGRKETFSREAVMSNKAVVSRGGTESCSI